MVFGISLTLYLTNRTLHECLEIRHFSSHVENIQFHSFDWPTREICDEYIKFRWLNCELKQSFHCTRFSQLEALIIARILYTRKMDNRKLLWVVQMLKKKKRKKKAVIAWKLSKKSKCPQWRRLFCSIRSVLILLCKGVREPRTHACTDLKCSKETCVQSHAITVLYSSVSFWAILSARYFRKRWHPFFTPPLSPNTKGVNEPISTSSTCCCYLRFFSSSCSLSTSDVVLFC